MYWYRFTSYPGAMPPMPAGNPWMGATATAGAPFAAGTAAEALANNVASAAASHHLPPQVPHPSLHPHYQSTHPSHHLHQPYTVDVYRSCRRSGPRFFPLLLLGGVSVWAFNKIYKLREENYDLRDRIRSDDKASLASATIASTSLSLDESKDANNKATSGRGDWRRDWRGRRYGGPRGEEEAQRI